MNRKEAAELLPIIQAYAEGKEIEIFNKTMKMWKTAMLPHFDCDSNIYRIKPERGYRPFKDAEECWQEMQKHQPFGWVKTKDKGIRLCMSGLNQKVRLHKLVINMMKPLMNSSLSTGFRLA